MVWLAHEAIGDADGAGADADGAGGEVEGEAETGEGNGDSGPDDGVGAAMQPPTIPAPSSTTSRRIDREDPTFMRTRRTPICDAATVGKSTPRSSPPHPRDRVR